MATVTLNVTNSVAITITVTSVANNGTATSNAIDNTTDKYVSAIVQLKVKTNAAGTSATGYVNVYMVRCADGTTTYDDAASTLIGSLPAIANATTYIRSFSTEPYGPLGGSWKVVVENKTGATLDASVGAVTLAGCKYDVA